MTKRRLNQQQLRRIDSNQQQRGKRATLAAAQSFAETTEEETGAETPGLVICHYGQQLDIESLAPESRGTVFRCHQRSNLPALVTGDKVIWLPTGDDTGVVVALQERRSVLSRPNAQKTQRPVAANVDIMAVVIAPVPEPFGNLIDRYLVAAESLGLQAIIVLNKTDLLDVMKPDSLEVLLSLYEHIGYCVVRVSSQNQHGLKQLQSVLASQTAVFVGQSGVGKSSLINALRHAGASEQSDHTEPRQQKDAAVGALSAGRDKGMHTTTATRLYHLPDSGDLIDSPGIREFGLWHMDQQQLIRGFVEFHPFIGRCRFRDCQHQQEPGCALLAACNEGLINRQRLHSYFHTLSTLPEP